MAQTGCHNGPFWSHSFLDSADSQERNGRCQGVCSTNLFIVLPSNKRGIFSSCHGKVPTILKPIPFFGLRNVIILPLSCFSRNCYSFDNSSTCHRCFCTSGTTSTTNPCPSSIQHRAVSLSLELGTIHIHNSFFGNNSPFYWKNAGWSKFGVLDMQPSCLLTSNCYNSLHASALFCC